MPFQIKDHFRSKIVLYRLHFSTLTFSFFITFILNYTISNLQLLVCNDETWHSYILPEQDPKNILIT